MRKLLLLTVSALGLSAQSPQATISGNVWDPQGAAVPEAEIVATNVATALATTAKTNQSGFYSLRNLAIGEYTVTISTPGFRRYQQKGLTLTTGQSLQLDIQLEVGQVTETVDVTASAQMLETRTSDVSQLVETKTVEDVPLGDRRTMNLINLIPAAVFVNYDAGSKPNFSLAGGRTQSQSFFIDGGTGQNMRLGVGQVDIDPPVETVAEVKVLSNNYAAEYGGSAGGVIIATTKSGTNRFKGTLFEYLRNEKLDAANFFAPVQNGEKVRAPLRYNVFGGTVGGPVKLPGYNGKDKTFFFFAYEGSRRRDGAVRTMTVPTALEKVGDFSQTRAANGTLIPVYDPATTRNEAGRMVRDQFPGNRIPSNRLDPVALNVMQFWPEPNRPADNLTGANNFRANYVNILTRNNFTGKVDHSLTSNDRLTFRYLYNSDHSDLTSVFPISAAETNSATVRYQHYGYVGWTRTFSPTVVNDVRWTYADRVNHQKSFGLEGEDWVASLGLRGVPSGSFPQFNVTGVQTLGAANHERRQFPIRQWQVVENLSWVRGQHTMKFGLEIRPSYNYETQRTSISGQFTFSPLATGQPGVAASGFGMASLLLGLPQNFVRRETEILDRSSYYLAWFAQTDWNVHRDLTLNIGVRWETDTPIVDKNNRMNGFDPLAINPVSGTPGVVKFMGVNGFQTSPYKTDWNNFGPRFGFAWKPFGSQRTVIRGGGGIFFAHPFDGGAPASAALGYEQSATLNSPDNGITFPFVLGQGVPAVQLGGAARDDSFGAVRIGQNPTTAVTYYEPNRATGYSMQWNFGVQRELPGNILIEAQYLANESRKLPSSSLSINQVPPDRMSPTATQRDRPFPQFSNVSVLFPTLGVSSYHAGTLKFTKRFSSGLNVLSTYTWSKFLNNTNEGGSVLGAEGGPYSDFYNRQFDWGPSENDVPQRFTFASVYDLPFGTGKRWIKSGVLRHAIGDWTISGVVTLQSGPPFTVTTQNNNTFAFSAGAQRADVVRNPNLDGGERTLGRWFDTAAFTQPANATFGNQGINILRSDGLVNMDLSLLKNFPIGEERKLQFRAETFNFTNTPSYGVPGRVFGGPGFGVVSSSSPGRRVQLGLRLVW